MQRRREEGNPNMVKAESDVEEAETKAYESF